MNILVSGASGLVGKRLCDRLTADGHLVSALSRRRTGDDDVVWNPAEGEIEVERLPEFDAVVHLAGESIAGGRWNAARKKRIYDSRVDGTRLLCESLAQAEPRPTVLVSASAIGYYGNRGDEVVDEASEPGNGFLADVCRDWEAATEPARVAGLRVVPMRIGVVLARDGGALSKMLLPFRLGGGGRVGSGRQYWSWITLDDLVSAIHHALLTDSLSGPCNAVAPNPATNLEFTKALGRVLRRPTIFPMPAFAARLALGEMADELLLSSTRVRPRRLQESNFAFQHSQLEEALRHAVENG